MKKFLTVVAMLALALALFAGCGRGEEEAPAATPPPAETPAPADTTDPVEDPPEEVAGFDEPATTVTIWFMGGGAENEDALVVEAANARLAELGLNIEISPIWTGGWAMGYPAQLALDTGDASVDIFWTGSWGLNFWNNARIGNFIRLDDPSNNLVERYGREMFSAVPNALWDAFTTDGPAGRGLYGIPGWKDYAQLHTWDVNVTRLEELGFDFDDLFDADGLNYDVFFSDLFEEVLQAAQDEWGPTFFPLVPEPNNFLQHLSTRDADLTGLHIFDFFFDPNNPALPVNPEIGLVLENPRTAQILERLHHFWNQGFIDPRMAIPGEASTVMGEIKMSGQYLFGSTAYLYGHAASASDLRGIDARFPRISSPIVSSISAAGSGFAISVYSRNQEAAMQFMNAWYTDTTLAVILSEGIEGIHWDYNAYGLITLITEGRATYSTWRPGMGNMFVLNPRNTDGHGFFDRFTVYNEAGTPTSLLGFTFNGDPVAIQMAALRGVVDEFNHTLTVGAVDPAAAMPAYLAALMANGADQVLEELNAQLQAFYAAR
ncbi:MAG: DUF3502 domain-containing protein [Defluviitaleaceae bacterium]|nr:DUF3502 domain-containing protein [Defluviitaleaceae bacterium]